MPCVVIGGESTLNEILFFFEIKRGWQWTGTFSLRASFTKKKKSSALAHESNYSQIVAATIFTGMSRRWGRAALLERRNDVIKRTCVMWDCLFVLGSNFVFSSLLPDSLSSFGALIGAKGGLCADWESLAQLSVWSEKGLRSRWGICFSSASSSRANGNNHQTNSYVITTALAHRVRLPRSKTNSNSPRSILLL